MTGRSPTVVVASDAFKGSLTSLEVADAVRLGVLDVLPGARVVVVPVADGGEGTVAAALASGWTAAPVDVPGPTGEPVTATLAVGPADGGAFSGLAAPRVVLVELADACGLGRLPGGVPAPLTASSRGLGVAIRAALDLGPAEVVVGVGGSASTDGGAGMLVALGARLLDADGRDLPDGGAALSRAASLDLTGLDPRLATTRLVLAADVDSPLLGPTGAAAVFGPQKGASPQDVAVLEAALAHWATVVDGSTPGTRSTNRSKSPHPDGSTSGTRSTYWSKSPHPDEPDRGTGSTYWSKLPHPGRMPGAGAAGGAGFALLAVLGAGRRSGIDVVLDLVGLDTALAGPDGTGAALASSTPDTGGLVDLVITGEGSIDAQTAAGKAVAGVARRARAHGIPVVAVCGTLALGGPALTALGVHTAYPLSELEPDPQHSMTHAADLLRRAAQRIAREWLSPAPG